jgi:hypothetical protein
VRYGHIVQAQFDTFNYQRGEVEVTFIRIEAWPEPKGVITRSASRWLR